MNLMLSVVLIAVFILVPLFLGLGKSGGFAYSSGANGTASFNFLLFQFIFYQTLGPIFLVGMLILLVIEIVIRAGDSKYGSSLLFNSPGDPPAPKIKYFFGWKGVTKLLLISIIIFSLLGMYAAYSNIAFTDVIVLQQFSSTDSLVFSGSLIPAIENLGAFFFFGLFLLFLRVIARKVKMSHEAFTVISVVAAIILFSLYGVILHQLVYAGNETAILSVLAFWGIMGIISVLSGSFIPGWILHIMNNLYLGLDKLYPVDSIIAITIVIDVVLIILYLLLFVRGKKR